MSNLSNEKEHEYWDWFAISLFLLTTVDMLTTIGLMAKYGLKAEANPVMKWLLTLGIEFTLFANLLVVFVTCLLFMQLIETIKHFNSPYSKYYKRWIEVWLGLLISAGLFVLANNVHALVYGQSLIVF